MNKSELAAFDWRRGDLYQRQAGRADSVQHCANTLAPLRMPWSRVVENRRGMARNYNLHGLTLAQVPSLLRVEGSWPGPITLRAGWFRAHARPWNEVISDPMVRLERGGTEFLIATVRRLGDLGVEGVFSPALYPGSSGVWKRSGFEPYARLDVMERSVDAGAPDTAREDVRQDPDPDWDRVLEVDRSAFEGFWGMSRLGLEEALKVSRSNAVLLSGPDNNLSGYAIVGSQWGTVYLHRIAVRPEDSGRGVGSALLMAAIAWGRRSGARSIVLNVRPDNERAKGLYTRHGFTKTHTALEVLRHERS